MDLVALASLVSILSTFYVRLLCPYFCAKKLKSLNVPREKMLEVLWYEKFKRKMLMKFPLWSPFGQNVTQ